MEHTKRATTTATTSTSHVKTICEHIKLERKNWDKQQNKTHEGKIFRGRPQRSTLEEAGYMRETLGLDGNHCPIATRIRPGLTNSTAQLAAKQQNSHQRITVLQEGDSPDDYIVPRSDEILVEVKKILVFRDKDPYVNAVCAKRRSKPKVNEKKISRERRAEVKNGYFRKTSMTVGERALNEGKAANSSKKGAKSKGKSCSETSTEITGEKETKGVELFNKECSQQPSREQ